MKPTALLLALAAALVCGCDSPESTAVVTSSGITTYPADYRLPTEAEWEYVARAGATTAYAFGDDPAALGEHAWFQGNSRGVYHPVAQKKQPVGYPVGFRVVRPLMVPSAEDMHRFWNTDWWGDDRNAEDI